MRRMEVSDESAFRLVGGLWLTMNPKNLRSFFELQEVKFAQPQTKCASYFTGKTCVLIDGTEPTITDYKKQI